MIVCPTLTCPSPAITTCPSWRTLRIVVWRNSAPGSIPLSDSREGTSINLFQMIHADVSIALRRRQARMPEHLLYRSKVRSVTKHMRCEGVTQPMGRDASVEAGRLDSALQDHFDATRGQPAAAKIRNHRTVMLPCNRHCGFPLLQCVQRRLAQRHEAILVALARAHQHHPKLVIYVAPVQPDQFADAQPRGVQGLEDCTIAQRSRRRRVVR